jgi:hypothetical protein
VQITMCPRRTRDVSAASAAREVNDSNVISSVGRGTVWKWSKSRCKDSGQSAGQGPCTGATAGPIAALGAS